MHTNVAHTSPQEALNSRGNDQMAIKICAVQCIFVNKTLSRNQRVKFKKFLLKVRNAQTKETKMQLSSNLNLISQRSNKYYGDLNRILPTIKGFQQIHVGVRIVAGQPKK